ncbi:hypothetical protein [Streptomyces sp. NBC_00385]|uniref:hypothetical protein n=1 Tax=Streptomyces sp. NBC_00385 TaxID=2975733 RepID=UPI002DD9423F|nr:hypothetical protein [Streptomyces sp. NBC_00385]WRZ06502.1 hypothetical protein OG959_25750 [Streptomyces sp. NBC_00385]
MISEPEMAGEFAASAEREVLAGAGMRPAVDRPPRVPGPRGRWLWALGGAVVASAVWGAVLFTDGSRDGAPDLHGYRLGQDPCADVRLKSIGAAISPREPADRFEAEMLRHAALDRAQCSIPLRSESGQKRSDKAWTVGYTVRVEIALHKQTDPAAEFEAERNETDLGVEPGTEVEAVPELGDKAYLLSLESGELELRVLEGGAVLSLRLGSYTAFEGGGMPPDDAVELPDLTPHKAAMISDMRDLMTDLKG